jgi:DNA-directed RNA polymerase specialized sigma24 family protein
MTEELMERCRKFAIKKGFPQLADDFRQEAAMGMLGPKQKIEHAFIDFLRKYLGAKNRNPHIYEAKKAERTASRDLDRIEMLYNPLPEVPFDDILKAIPNNIDRAVVSLYFVWGLSCREIGLCFGVSESRICKRLNSSLETLKTTYYNTE